MIRWGMHHDNTFLRNNPGGTRDRLSQSLTIEDVPERELAERVREGGGVVDFNSTKAIVLPRISIDLLILYIWQGKTEVISLI
jgi:acyl CoA:acetate/3-ketoacid CoA transferase alpha subunit